MKFLRDNKAFLALLIPFMAIPWIRLGDYHLLLFNFSHNRFEYLGFATEMSTSAMVMLVILLGISLALMIALSLSRFYCGTLCPNTLFAHVLSLVSKTKGSYIRKSLGFIFLLFLSFLFAFSVVAYGVDTAELRQALINLSFSGWLVIFFSALMTAEVFMIQGWYCAYLCPYGAMCAILPIEDRLTYRFNDPEHHCTECAGCVKICPIPDLDIRKGFDLRCIQCGLCEDACTKSFAKHPDRTALIACENRTLFRAAGKAYGLTAAIAILLLLSMIGAAFLLQEARLESCKLENMVLY